MPAEFTSDHAGFLGYVNDYYLDAFVDLRIHMVVSDDGSITSTLVGQWRDSALGFSYRIEPLLLNPKSRPSWPTIVESFAYGAHR